MVRSDEGITSCEEGLGEVSGVDMEVIRLAADSPTSNG